MAFGPTGTENYTRKLNTSAKRTALRQALSLAAAQEKVKIIETFAFTDGKVKPTVKLLDKIGAKGTTLIVVPDKDKLAERATRNIPGLKVVQAGYVNVFDILNSDNIIISQKSLEILKDWLGGDK